MNAAGKLVAALKATAEAAGCSVQVTPTNEKPWASATFVGALHALSISGDGSAEFEMWLDTLGGAEFATRGHVVADVAVERRASDARVTALILDAT